MWKRAEVEPEESVPAQAPIQRKPTHEQAVIGPSLVVKGDVLGEEDLTIQGQVEGKVVLKNNSVTVGKNGRLKADINAKIVYVEGFVQGNLYGEEKIIVRSTGEVRGNLVAARVILEDGAKFKGSIDMESGGSQKQRELSMTEGGGRIAGPGPRQSSASEGSVAQATNEKPSAAGK